MKEGYKFVYSLIDNGNVFYVGCARDIKARYKQHLTLSSICSGPSLRKYMSELLAKGIYPDLNIIDYLPADDALRLEDKIIMYFSKAGHNITNERSTTPLGRQRPKGAPETPTLKEQMKIIQFKIDTWFHRNSLPTPKWKPYPSSPFENINAAQ